MALREIVLVAMALACGVGASWLQNGGKAEAKALGAVAAPSPAAEMIVAGLGGFRSLAAEVVWFRAERLQDEGRYAELAQLATYLTYLEPHTAEVWAYSSWNLAYNISVMMPTPADRWRWVSAALRLLRDDGLRLNPGDPRLYRELAWLFLLKMGVSLDKASEQYRVEWAKEVEAARAANDWGRLKMDDAQRQAVDREYGAQDWNDPLASSLYWAHLGLQCAKKRELRRELRQVVYQTLMVEANTNPAFAPRALKEMRLALREDPNPLVEKIAGAFAARHGLEVEGR